MSTFAAGVIGIVVIVVFTYLVFTKFANPFANHSRFTPRSPARRPASGVAGADRRRQRRQGHEHRTGPRLQAAAQTPGRCSGRRRDDRRSTSRGCRCTRRDVRDPPAHVPGGQLLRRRQPGHAVGPDGARRPHVPGPAGRRAGPARPGADLAAGRHPPQPADLLQQYGTAVKQGGPALQPLDPVLAAGLQVLVDRRPRRARDPAPRPVELDRRRRARSPARSSPTRTTSRASSRTSTRPRTLSRARTSRSRTPWPSCRARSRPRSPRWTRSTPRCRRVETLARALLPGVVSAGPAIDASLPFITQLRAARPAVASWAGWRPTSRRRSRRSPS